MAKALGSITSRMELMGLVVSNGIIALSVLWWSTRRLCRCFDVGLASLIIGEVLFLKTNLNRTFAQYRYWINHLSILDLGRWLPSVSIPATFASLSSWRSVSWFQPFKEKMLKGSKLSKWPYCRIKNATIGETRLEWRNILVNVSLEIHERWLYHHSWGNGAKVNPFSIPWLGPFRWPVVKSNKGEDDGTMVRKSPKHLSWSSRSKDGDGSRMTGRESPDCVKFEEKSGLSPRRLAQYKYEFKEVLPDWQWIREACRLQR